ncbi:hypothetical protein DOY81_012781 [Sarcophaga bullata]|nr:hypothetical protein DOY81_012781 [Sarcophaga bullata]
MSHVATTQKRSSPITTATTTTKILSLQKTVRQQKKMLTKLPDYIVSECGYPDWPVEEKENIKLAQIQTNLWHTSTIWSRKSTNYAKLLPLRESLTDYYRTQLMLKQNQDLYTKSTHFSLPTRHQHSGRPKTKQVNEMINNAKRKQQQCVLDKRRSHHKQCRQ